MCQRKRAKYLRQDLNNYQNHLKDMGVKDSKLLKPKVRNELYQLLKEEMSLQYVQLTPAIIDGNFFQVEN